MNKVYKLVYSRTLNQLQVVSELATSAAYGSSVRQIDEVDQHLQESSVPRKLAMSFALSTLFTALPMGAALADTRVEKDNTSREVATETNSNDATLNKHLNYVSEAGYNANNPGVAVDKSFEQNTTVEYKQNVPVVNINTPNKAGVSDNRFNKFSTDTGVVFNNNPDGTISLKSSILAEKIAANPNLKEAARTILTQVTGNDKTVIRGVMEVLGKNADLIVINPHGIDLNGVKLVNTKDFVAATAEISDDNYRKLHVTEGEINVNKDFSTDDVNLIRLIAKAVKIKATIAPSRPGDNRKADIVVSAGSQDYDLERNVVKRINTKTASVNTPATANTPEAQTQVAISGDTLGSMYGRQVNFIVTDSGAGVEFDGLIVGDDDIYVTADGRIKTHNSYSAGQTLVTSRNGDVEVTGTARAHDRIELKGASVNTEKAEIQSSTLINVVAKEDTAAVGNLTASQINIAAHNTVTSDENSQILSNNTVVYAGQDIVFGGKVYANDNLDVTTRNYEVTNTNAINLLGNAEVEANKKAVASATQPIHETSIEFQNEVIVAGLTTLSADTINFDGKKVTYNDETANSHDFAFNNLNLNFNVDRQLGGVNLKDGSFASNDLFIDFNKSGILPSTKPLFTSTNGKYNVYGTTYLNLTKGGVSFDLNSQAKFDALNAILDSLNSTSAHITASSIYLDKDKNIEMTQASTFKVKSYYNAGTIRAGNSFGVIAKDGSITNPGLLYAKGDVVFNSNKDISINGGVYSLKNAMLTAPLITQQGTLHVGGDLIVNANKYDLVARTGGDIKLTTGGYSYSPHWYYHGLRKDLNEIYTQRVSVDTSGLYFSPAETIVKGNMVVSSYDDYISKLTPDRIELSEADKASQNLNRSTLHVKDGRLYVGKNLKVDGNIDVESTTYQVNLLDILMHPNEIMVSFTPFTLFDTELWGTTTKTYKSLFDLFEKTFGRDSIKAGFYESNSINVFNSLIADQNLGPVLNKVLTSVFEADWRSVTIGLLSQKWEYFKEHYKDYNIAVFAPKSEVFAGEYLVQNNGYLNIGSGLQIAEDYKYRDHAYDLTEFGKKNPLNVISSEQALISQKINGLQTTSNYLLTLKDNLKKYRNGTYELNRKVDMVISSADYENIGLLNLADYTRNIGDDGTLALIILEQIKDLGGASVTAKDKLIETYRNVINGTIQYRNALATITEVSTNRFEVDLEGNGKKTVYKSYREAYEAVSNNFDHVNFIIDRKLNGLYVPQVSLSKKTTASLTNFNKVAASLTAVDSISSVDTDFVNVNFGSLNSKVVKLDTNGNMNLTSQSGQFVINANNTILQTKGDLKLTGSADFGNLNAKVDGDTTFRSLVYITDRGDLANQSILKAKNVNLDTDDLKMKASRLFASADVNIKSKTVELKSEYNEASNYESLAIKNAWSGRMLNQIGAFVIGSHIEGENVHLAVEKDLESESSNIVANNNLTLDVGGNLTTTAKSEYKYIDGSESKVVFSFNARASFGSWATYAERVSNLNYNLDGSIYEGNIVFSDTQTSLTGSGAPLARVATGLQKDKTEYSHKESTAVNNNFDATNLTINVGKHAELGNTNINTINSGYNVDNQVKTAVINAESVRQTQKQNWREIEIKNEGWGIETSAYFTSSIADVASHLTSSIRSADMHQRIGAKSALTGVSDALGLITRDAANIGAKLTVGGHKNTAHIFETYDSTNHVAGNLAINTKGDTQLKAIDGSNLVNLDVTASNFTVEGATHQSEKKIDAMRAEVSIGANIGVGLYGVSASATLQASGSRNTSWEVSTTHRNSILSATNININTSGDLTLRGANLNAIENVNVKTNKLTIETLNDVYRLGSNTFTISGAVGTSLGADIVPFGQIGGRVGFTTEDKQSPNELSGITSAGNLNVVASELDLTGAIIAAEKGNVTAQSVKNRNLNLVEDIQGLEVGGDFGLNKNITAVASVNGAIDTTRRYIATLRSTVGNSVVLEVDGKREGFEVTAGENKGSDIIINHVHTSMYSADSSLNRDQWNMINVHEDNTEQSVPFSFVGSSALIADTHRIITKIKTAVESAYTKASNVTFSGQGHVEDNIPVAPLMKDASTQTDISYTKSTVSSGTQTNGSYNGPSNVNIGREIANEFLWSSNTGYYNSGGSTRTLNYESGTGSSYGYTNYNGNTLLNYGNSSGADTHQDSHGIANNNGNETIRNQLNNNYYVNENGVVVVDQGVQTELSPELVELQAMIEADQKAKNNSFFKFTQIGNNRISSESRIEPYKIFGSHSSTSNSVSQGINSFNNAAKLFNSVEDVTSNALIYYRPITQQFGSVFRQRNLPFNLDGIGDSEVIQNVDLSSMSGNVYVEDSNNQNVSGSGGMIDGSDFDFGGVDVGSVGNGNHHVGGDINTGGIVGDPNFTPDHSNGNSDLGIGSEPIHPGVVADNPDGGRLDIPEFEVPNVDIEDGTVKNPSTTTNNGTSTGSDITLPKPKPQPKPDSGVTSTEGKTDITLPSTGNGNVTGTPSDDVLTDADNEVDNAHNSANGATGGSTSDKTASDKDKAENEEESSDETSTAEEDKSSTSSNNTAESTPADNNAKDGDIIKLDERRQLRKLVLDNVTCYVMNTNAKASVASGSHSPANTLFSTYSNSIIDSLGDNGVICLPTASDILKTDFNVVASTNNDSSRTTERDTRTAVAANRPNNLDVVIVAKQSTTFTQLVANDLDASLTLPSKSTVKLASFKGANNTPAPTAVTTTTTTKTTQQKLVAPAVKPVPLIVDTTLITDIQKKLRANGVDPTRLLILSNKSSVVAPNASVKKSLRASDILRIEDFQSTPKPTNPGKKVPF